MGFATVNSNTTGLRIAEEASPKVLPNTPVWEPQEPNGYGDFGAETKTEARAPIAADRQRRKGPVVDVDAMAGFTADFTTKAFVSLMQGFLFASWRRKPEFAPTAVTTTAYTVPSGGAAVSAGSIVFAEGFAVQGNNGLRVVSASADTSISTTAGLTAEASPPAGAKVTRVGTVGSVQGILVVGGVVTVTGAALNLQGIIPGEWFWLGGDSAESRFDNPACNGLYRARTVSAGAIVCDRAPDGVATDAGVGKGVFMFLGHVVKNEADPTLQVQRTYQAERLLSPTTAQYVTGCLPNQFDLDVKTSSKVTCELKFMGLDEETPNALKSGVRPGLPAQSAYSSTTDFARLRLLNDTSGAALATYLTDLKLSIDNGAEAIKAIGSTGGVDHSVGDFKVTGSVEAFFSTMEAVRAVRANVDVALDFGLVTNVTTPGVGTQAVGWLFDVPLITLGDARLKVEKDKPIKLPLSMDASAHTVLNHTLLVMNFPFLPQLAN